MNQPHADGKSVSTSQDVLVGFAGLATSLVTALILWRMELALDFAFYSWMFWFVIPVGAILSGFAGASGYYAGARLFNHRPTRLLLLNIILASVATFLMIHFLSYVTLSIDGTAVRDRISFLQYLDLSIQSTSMEFRYRTTELGGTGQLGGLGYGVASLQVLGFALGGLAVYGYLTSVPYCDTCSRYFANKGKRIRFTSDAEALHASTAQVLTDIQQGAIASAVEGHGRHGNTKYQKGNHLKSVVEVRYCANCGKHWVKHVVEKLSGSDWKEIPDLTAEIFTKELVEI